MRKKLLALLLTLFLLSLAACAQTRQEGAAAQPEREADQSAAAQPEEETAAPTEEADAAAPAASDAEVPAGETDEVPDAETAESPAPATEEPLQPGEGEWMTPGEGADADGRGPDETDGEVEPVEGAPIDPDAITEAEFEGFTATVPGAAAQAKGFRDFAETMQSDFTGTWYDPKAGEAFRITDRGAYVYIPYLELWGDQCCDWELIDRAEQGKCPKLVIYCFGTYDYGLAYYVAGNTGDYFWCVSQGQLFYRQ